MKQNELCHEKALSAMEIEKNFILILKPDDIIKCEANRQKIKNAAPVKNMIEQLLDEFEYRELLESEKLRDIKFLITDYFDSNSSEQQIYNRDNFLYDDDSYNDNWDTPYDENGEINLIY
jgi:hypothetical protein